MNSLKVLKTDVFIGFVVLLDCSLIDVYPTSPVFYSIWDSMKSILILHDKVTLVKLKWQAISLYNSGINNFVHCLLALGNLEWLIQYHLQYIIDLRSYKMLVKVDVNNMCMLLEIKVFLLANFEFFLGDWFPLLGIAFIMNYFKSVFLKKPLET